jgi:hypothetical protein
MNNSSFLEQSTNILDPYQLPEVELEEKLLGGPLDIIEKQENNNEMNKKTKQKIDYLQTTQRKKHDKLHNIEKNNKNNETYQQ